MSDLSVKHTALFLLRAVFLLFAWPWIVFGMDFLCGGWYSAYWRYTYWSLVHFYNRF